MNIIVFDLLSSQPVGDTKYHGGGEYIKTVFFEFVTHQFKDCDIIVCFNKDLFLDDYLLELIHSNKLKIVNVKKISDITNFLNTFSVNDSVRFFAGLLYWYHSCTFPSNVITIGTCHGLRILEKPSDKYFFKYFSFKEKVYELLRFIFSNYFYKRHYNIYLKSINNFDYIITDSYNSLYSIKLHFGSKLKEKDFFVFYPCTQSVGKIDINTNGDYILLVSSNRWIKNSFRGVMAIDSLYSKGWLRNTKTKVYGKLPKSILHKIKNKDMFELFDYVDSVEIENAYKNCKIFFYPSLNEGFGNVPMEAMKYGKTCVVSAVCSLTEVYKNSVYYCNPYDVKEMGIRLLQANDIPINENILISRLNELNERQRNDMEKLCDLIAGV